MEHLGLGWDAVRHNRLIYCSLPGFASDDPRAAMPAWEGVVAAVQGLGGAPLEAQLEACFGWRSADEWVRLLAGAGIGAHTLGRVTPIMQDPRAVAHGLSVIRRHRDGSVITTVGPPARLSRTPTVPGRPVSPPAMPRGSFQ